jgi:MSHA biogenesis protein MshP
VRQQAGFTLVSAIFLMVVLVVLGVSLVTISSVAHTTTAQQLQSVRAHYAVRAGIEWAAARAATGCPPGPTTFSPGGTLSGFTVSVSCTQTSHPLPTVTVALARPTQLYYVADITATAGAYGGTDYVLRKGQTKILGPVPVPP